MLRSIPPHPRSCCSHKPQPHLQVSTVGTLSAYMGCCGWKVKGGTTTSQRAKQGDGLQQKRTHHTQC
jgi:hypothetical protein